MSWAKAAVAAGKVYSGWSAGQTGKIQANAQSELDEGSAQAAEKQGQDMAKLIRKAGQAQVGQTNASYAASGVQVGTGSAGEVEKQITTDYEHDAYQAILEGKTKARSLRLQGRLGQISANANAKTGWSNALGSAASSFVGGWSTKSGG